MLPFPRKNDVRFVSALCILSLFIYLLCVLMIFCRLTVIRRVSHVEQEQLTLPEHTSSPCVFSGVRVTRSLVFRVMFCRSLFAFWPLCCLSFDLWLPITPLVSSNLFSGQPFQILFFFSSFFLNLVLCYFLADRKLPESNEHLHNLSCDLLEPNVFLA